ncbi:MAG: adenylate/guanylate cyclase domain-containing protein [Deltaproteobacteria bacterium]|nr:adenylate/guanylate cyclase domain-containing protein [Deltaproteobacteria bacterium]
MAKVLFRPDDRTVETDPGETLLDVAKRSGIPLAHACGGNARCTTCRVMVLEGRDSCSGRTAEEAVLAEQAGFGPGIRLACQTKVDGEAEIRRLVLDDRDVELTSVMIEGAALGRVGREKHVIVMFADIRSFTTFSANLLPYDVVHLLNRYFHQMGAIIRHHGGSIDNYMGDGLMALFETDEPADGALRAVRAGLEMLESVELLKPYVTELHGRAFDIGIGIHCGLVVAGTIGEPGSSRHTVIGDAVNFASRVESANKRAGTRLLVSQDVHTLLGGRARTGRSLTMSLKGVEGEHTLHEIVSLGPRTPRR